jgi:hypothetical protein
MKAPRAVLLVALAILAIVAFRDLARLGDASPWRQLYDFGDFYCAGSAIAGGADPYRYEPLHRCEHRVNLTAAYRRDPLHVVPAPLPPYDFPPFQLLARLDFANARVVAAAAIVVAILFAIWGMVLVGLPSDVAALAFALPAGYVLLNAGQIVPFALLGLVFCGVALARGRYAVAGVLAALTLIEPHLGLPVCLALLVCVPASRLGLLGTCAALAAIAAGVAGVSEIGEYVARVLPAQGAAETGYPYQYSLTYLLHRFGMPPAAALFAGEISYAAMLAFAIWIARRTAAILHRPELIAYLPAACSVAAGAYVHMVDLAFAIPAALVLAWSLEGWKRSLAAVALCLLTIPWIPVWITKKLFVATLLVVALLLLRLRIPVGVAAASFAVIVACIYLLELFPPAPLVATTPGPFLPTDLVQRAWGAYVAALGDGGPLWLVVKVPTWLGLGGVFAAALATTRNPAEIA